MNKTNRQFKKVQVNCNPQDNRPKLQAQNRDQYRFMNLILEIKYYLSIG